MRTARDTFLHYLADFLPSLTFKYVRFDRNDPTTQLLQENAVNIQFISDESGVATSRLTASIDVIFDDELQAVDVADKIRWILQRTGMTPKMSYSENPLEPTPTGTNLYWNTNSIRFKSVPSAFNFHYSCTLVVRYHST